MLARTAMLPEMRLVGSGTGLVEKSPEFCAVKPLAIVPVTPLNARAELPVAVVAPPSWAMIAGLRFVKVEVPLKNVPPVPFTDKVPFVSVEVKRGPPVVVVNVMVPEKLSSEVAPAPATVGLVRVKVSRALTGVGIPPMLEIVTGIAVAFAPVPVVNTVVPLTTRSVTTSVILVWPKTRIVAALAVLAKLKAARNAKPRVALMSLRKAASSIDEHQGVFRK